MRDQTSLTIPLSGDASVSGLLDGAATAVACYVLAHGAGAGMDHPFMTAIARGLAERRVASLRFQFPYMEQGSRRPDPPALAQAVVRAAVREAAKRLPKVPLFAGGKSYGGRMTSQAQAAEPLPNVRGIVFLGFPLHQPGKPSIERAEHLGQIKLPMLFLQGTRDTLANLDLIRDLAARLGRRATLHIVEGADHSFHVAARSGRNDAEVRAELLDAMASWMRKNEGFL